MNMKQHFDVKDIEANRSEKLPEDSDNNKIRIRGSKN